jgi:CBS domain-containing protein
MRKMLARDIRHLPICDEQGDVIGMLSIKDIVKELIARQQEVITRLTDFNMGKGAFFEHT